MNDIIKNPNFINNQNYIICKREKELILWTEKFFTFFGKNNFSLIFIYVSFLIPLVILMNIIPEIIGDRGWIISMIVSIVICFLVYYKITDFLGSNRKAYEVYKKDVIYKEGMENYIVLEKDNFKKLNKLDNKIKTKRTFKYIVVFISVYVFYFFVFILIYDTFFAYKKPFYNEFSEFFNYFTANFISEDLILILFLLFPLIIIYYVKKIFIK